MIKITKLNPFYILIITIGIFMFSCKEEQTKQPENLAVLDRDTPPQAPKAVLTEEFKNYWYNGEAEITSYKLEQARYGEIRNGYAVLIYVTEDFLPHKQVKADNYNEKNIPILKLNATKNFNTGIYPYSIMQSTFFPVANNQHALKITSSIQEWCGQTFVQLNNRENFEIQSHSYFQSEADDHFNLEKTWTENELWTKLRIDPKTLPTGNFNCIPSLEYTRIKHQDIRAYNAVGSLNDSTYTLRFQELNRTLKIYFNPNAPYDIQAWEEMYDSGFGEQTEVLTTKATKLKTLKTDYWTKNKNADENLRATLKLP